MTPDLLSAIVLLEPTEQPGCLEEVLLSLAVQEYSPLQVIVVCSEKQNDEVSIVAQNQPWPSTTQFETILLQHGSKDNNANRLNVALNTCRGQFVTVLCSSDVVYGFAFAKLIAVLHNGIEPVAVAGTRDAYIQADGYMARKANHPRPGKRTNDIWFDEDCARNFVIDRNRLKGSLVTEPALDYFGTYFLLLALSLRNEFNFSLATESLFERRTIAGQEKLSDDIERMRLRARSKIIDWKSAQLTEFRTKSQALNPAG
ncbi:MAG: glycosyltransferase family A protein [Candidatus Obscuribacterales bacterium]|nr:glycosyltransferase family A protein [Candidatus Obscuribacterales bacterium]